MSKRKRYYTNEAGQIIDWQYGVIYKPAFNAGTSLVDCPDRQERRILSEAICEFLNNRDELQLLAGALNK